MKKNSARSKIITLLFVVLSIAILGIGYRMIQYIKLKRGTEQQAVLNVSITIAKRGPPSEEIILPGNVQAWHETTIFARTNGYVINWMVDIGTHVKTGDLLAKISAPEVDAQLRQTEADLKTAQENYKLAKITARRWCELVKTDSVSRQDTDMKISDERAKAAIVASTQATRDRLRDLVSFQQIIAPFEGVIMSRTTDIGNLINAGSGTVPLFRLVQANPLRVYVRVPEYFARNIKPNIIARLYFNERPGKSYGAKLLDTARAIDFVTRTLLVQLIVDNSNYELLAGSYTQVHFMVPSNKTAVRLPVNTLIFRAKGLQVATVDSNSRARFKHIIIGRDFGNVVEVISGLSSGEHIILNPPDSLIPGQKVKVVSSKKDNK